MEEEKRKPEFDKRDNEIIYSQSIKAGKRIYYLDVKKSRNEDLYLAITESKKKVTGFDNDAQVSYEKHKIFLYKEDFKKFKEGLEDVIDFIIKEQGEPTPRPEYKPRTDEDGEEKANSVDDIDFSVEDNNSDDSSDEPKKSFFDKFKF